MAIKINDILIEGGGTTHECEFTVPPFYSLINFLYYTLIYFCMLKSTYPL